MDVSIYNKGWVIPAKSGSRYLDELFSIHTQYNSHCNGIEWGSQQHTDWMEDLLHTPFVKIAVPSESVHNYHFLPLTHMVIRHPTSHLYSALHTDLWGQSGHWGVDTVIDVEDIETVNPAFKSTLLKYLDEGTGHYSSDLYRGLWRLSTLIPTMEVILLDNLNRFLSTEGYHHTFQRSNYNWEASPTDIQRVDLIHYIQKRYPSIWKRIEELNRIDTRYFYRIGESVTLPNVLKLIPPKPKPIPKTVKWI